MSEIKTQEQLNQEYTLLLAKVGQKYEAIRSIRKEITEMHREIDKLTKESETLIKLQQMQAAQDAKKSEVVEEEKPKLEVLPEVV